MKVENRFEFDLEEILVRGWSGELLESMSSPDLVEQNYGKPDLVKFHACAVTAFYYGRVIFLYEQERLFNIKLKNTDREKRRFATGNEHGVSVSDRTPRPGAAFLDVLQELKKYPVEAVGRLDAGFYNGNMLELQFIVNDGLANAFTFYDPSIMASAKYRLDETGNKIETGRENWFEALTQTVGRKVSRSDVTAFAETIENKASRDQFLRLKPTRFYLYSIDVKTTERYTTEDLERLPEGERYLRLF